MDRQLRAAWSRDAANDLQAWHNLDAEQELTRILATEINNEIDRETIADLREVAGIGEGIQIHPSGIPMDAGYFYAPYVPLVRTPVVIGKGLLYSAIDSWQDYMEFEKPMQPVVLDPNSFVPREGVMTRYGKRLLREGSRYYSRISISNLMEE